MKLVSINPASNGEILGEVEETTREEIVEKVSKAREIKDHIILLGELKYQV